MKKRGPTPALPEGLEIVIRHWPHMPDHLQRSFAEVAGYYSPKSSNGKRFPTPEGATVEIVLLTRKEARITVGAVCHSYTFAGLGLANSRRPSEPRAEWRMLRTYAENPHPDAYYRLPYRKSLKVETSKFRRWLQGFFGLPGDPLRPFRPARWLPRFRIRAEYL